jgi:histidine ammonia-lyase
MNARHAFHFVFVCLFSINTATAQTAGPAPADSRTISSNAGDTRTDAADAQSPQAVRNINEIIDRTFKREREEIEIVES